MHFGTLMPRRAVLLLVIILVNATLVLGSGFTTQASTAAESNGAATSTRYVWSLVGDSTANLSEQQAAGIQARVVRLSWRDFEPSEGTVSDSYVAAKRTELQTMRALGYKLILDIGFHDTPDWLHTTYGDASYYVNQYGGRYSGNGMIDSGDANLIFNGALRLTAARYVAAAFGALGRDFYAVRIGAGRWGELMYPPNYADGQTNCYWAFDPTALAQSPVPNWRPGQPSPNGEARTFINWYLDQLVGFQNWQIDTIEAHFSGYIMVLYPSWGVRPNQLEQAIAGSLSGATSTEVNGELQRGLDFERLIRAIDNPKVVASTTWLDAPAAGDATTDAAIWSPIKYLSELAKSHPLRLPLFGENTGQGTASTLRQAAAQMEQYNLLGLVWYREAELGYGQYATLGDYAQTIRDIEQKWLPANPTATATFTPSPTRAPATAIPTSAPAVGTGLTGQYYDNKDLTSLKTTRVDGTVNFNWGRNIPATGVRSDTFSVRWTGQVMPAYTETVTFYVRSDDGLRLWVNGQRIINNWTNHTVREDRGTISLVAGQRYNIVLEYFDNSDNAVAQLSWSSVRLPKQIIPQSRLFPASTATAASAQARTILVMPASTPVPVSSIMTLPTATLVPTVVTVQPTLASTQPTVPPTATATSVLADPSVVSVTVPVCDTGADVDGAFLESDVIPLGYAARSRWTTGLRFCNAAVPAGATIVSAVVELRAANTSASPLIVDAAFEQADDSADFTRSSLPSARVRGAAVQWDVSAWQADATYRTPELAAGLQTVVSRAGWRSGNDIGLVIAPASGNGYRLAHVTNAHRQPRLTIRYVMSAPIAQTPMVTPSATPIAETVSTVTPVESATAVLTATSIPAVDIVPTVGAPTDAATVVPTAVMPTETPTFVPTLVPPTDVPTEAPTLAPPTDVPTEAPTEVAPPPEAPAAEAAAETGG